MVAAESWLCPRCQRKVPALLDYPVGKDTRGICHDCWGDAAGRPYQGTRQAPAQLSIFDLIR